jgi:serine/threonine protein kinase
MGSGSFAVVSSETDPTTGERIALKLFIPRVYDQTKFIREVETLVKLNHPCVLRISGWKPPTPKEPAEIRTELAENGSLSGILEQVSCKTQFPFWDPTGKGILICGIALGMRFIHSKGIIHGDLKPSNILVNRPGEALISDFGVSRREFADYTLTPESGTINYAAPELFREGAPYTRKVDVFAFGLVVYEVLTGTAVFPSTAYAAPILTKILSGEMPVVPDECGSLMQDLIPRCWKTEPEERPTFDEIIREFDVAGFRIVPGADDVKLGIYVGDIQTWEAEEAARSRSK